MLACTMSPVSSKAMAALMTSASGPHSCVLFSGGTIMGMRTSACRGRQVTVQDVQKRLRGFAPRLVHVHVRRSVVADEGGCFVNHALG